MTNNDLDELPGMDLNLFVACIDLGHMAKIINAGSHMFKDCNHNYKYHRIVNILQALPSSDIHASSLTIHVMNLAILFHPCAGNFAN